MLKTLERYQKCSYPVAEAVAPSKELQQNSYQEYLKLKGRVEVLQRSQRNLLGEDLGSLSTRELEQLENQLDVSLKHIRTTKLQEVGPENPLQLSWGNNGAGSSTPYNRQPAHSEALLQPLGFDPALQIGYTTVHVEQMNPDALAQNVHGGFVNGWM
ncbi:hypothetical protein Taro_046438 [Colocasia esculenta]|uniref:K-box domain-containing protein n=1 Tax=Colocasia esculenta TaxID=4460 RepID=A0A843X651_COLES|nr:hypothetical protein [Colocasia esculenta]